MNIDIQWFYTATTWVLPALLAITLHEAGHGWAAWKLGDDTAWRLGRVSINPLRHIDLFGTILLPLMLKFSGAPVLFGYAKPVPVQVSRLNRPRRDMVWVALAGPGANLLQALFAALIVRLIIMSNSEAALGFGLNWIGDNLLNAIQINLILAVFNMLPVPPLDGGRVAVGLLPDRLAIPLARMERTGILVLLGLMILVPMVTTKLGFGFDPFTWLIGWPVHWLTKLFFAIAGLT
jgi:Zn-dependent protease